MKCFFKKDDHSRFGLISKTKLKLFLLVTISINIVFFVKKASGQTKDSIKSIYNLSLKDLAGINVTTVSLKEEEINIAASNITVITRQMIDERGYQTLVEICEDLPGFDFMMFNDGGGEYPTYNMNRGVGIIGNANILIMVDGIIQNNISFNWSLLWTYENLFADIERIEVIEGPGSAIYGAQAYTGIIHFITRSKFSGVEVKSFYGSDFTRGIDIYAGHNFKENIGFSLAFHKYNSDGDKGDRYDPGNYFHNLQFPSTILQDYDANGNYVTNVANSKGGQAIPDGFQNWNGSYSFRAKINFKNTEIGSFLWDVNRGFSSAINGYEYNLMHSDHSSRSGGYHIYAKNEAKLADKLSLQSNLVFRATHILPNTGFRYNYQFPELTKNYVSYEYQGFIEERAHYDLSEKTNLLLGIKGTRSIKSRRVVSLGYFPEKEYETQSSWEEANAGNGIGIFEEFPPVIVNEFAAYGLWNNQWTKNIYSSIGLRYDYSSEYGQIANPRVAFIYNPAKVFGTKLLYGTAFRQPSIFELNSEFRGNPDLEPEKINTYELELNSMLLKDKIQLRTNIFYSKMLDFIGKVPDISMPAGERYENLDKSEVSGISFYFTYKFLEHIRFYSNYMFMTGKAADTLAWEQIERTAKNKVNAGINFHLFKNKLIIDGRVNYVGERKAQSTNKWLYEYENGYAPAYSKVNLTISYEFVRHFTAQFIINNVFDVQYYGVGRETGSGMVDEYDYQTNPNPEGHIPAYHPQPGRTFLIRLNFKL
ncbi:MAG: TonB-dependent receptor [Bacteroidota bacterium]